jgi:PEP-CTERM motif
MKRTVIALALGLVGTLAVAMSSHAQGYVFLDNYSSSGPLVGGLGGAAADATYTVGLYWALGNVVSSVGPDASGIADPSTLGGGLVLGTGTGSTVAINEGPGYFSAILDFSVSGGSAGGLVTLMLIDYNGSSYATSLDRGHSAAFDMTMISGTAPAVSGAVGSFMPGTPGEVSFSAYAVPEPATMALVGIGAAGLMFFRRRKVS